MAVLFEFLFVGVLFRLLAFFLGVFASLVGLALEIVVVFVRHLVWPAARWAGRVARAVVRGRDHGRGRPLGSTHLGQRPAMWSTGRRLRHQESVLAGARAALTSRG